MLAQRGWPHRMVAVGVLAAMLVSTAGCQQSETSADAQSVSPRELLQRLAATYAAASSYEDVGELHILAEDSQQHESQPFAVAFERPGRIRIHALDTMVVADGQTLRAVAPSLDNQVLVRPLQGSITLDDFSDELLSQAMRGQLDAGMPQLMVLLDEQWLDNLLREHQIEQLPDVDYLGESCRRVAVSGAEGTAVFWIARDSNLLRKFEFPMRAIRERFPLAAVWADFKGARVGGEINKLAFQMELPESVRQVKQFILPPPEAPTPLLGQAAGDFTFVGLDGVEVSRDSLAGKVVVLDLWATWCGWCFRGLPLLETVYQRFKDDPRVVFLAVSKDETAVSDERVKAAFSQHKLSIPIVRDLRQVSDAVFQVQALPTSVLLGSDGTVQDYHLGFDAKLEQTLPEKIERLLAGENLAQQQLDGYRRAQQEYEQRLSDVLVAAPPAQGEAEVARNPATAH